MNKKAIFFTIDAIIAIVTATALTLSAYYALAHTNPVNLNEERFYELTLSVLDAADKDKTLYDTIAQNNASIMDSYMDELSSNQCGTIRFYDSANMEILNATKSDCIGLSSQFVTAARRTVVVDGSMYTAKLEMWWK